MTVALVADAHLGGPGGEAEGFVRQIEALPDQGCSRLVLLGDLFHVWVAMPKYETEEVREVLAAVRELRRRHVEVDYVEGNRDFFVAEGSYKETFDRVGCELDFEHGGKRYLVTHGDGLDPHDRLYPLWRRLAKNRLTRLLAGGLPASWGKRAFGGTERLLAPTNEERKVHIPEAELRLYGRRRLSEGYDVLLMGHFHEPRRFLVPEGEIRLLEAWFVSRRLEWLERVPPAPAEAPVGS